MVYQNIYEILITKRNIPRDVARILNSFSDYMGRKSSRYDMLEYLQTRPHLHYQNVKIPKGADLSLDVIEKHRYKYQPLKWFDDFFIITQDLTSEYSLAQEEDDYISWFNQLTNIAEKLREEEEIKMKILSDSMKSDKQKEFDKIYDGKTHTWSFVIEKSSDRRPVGKVTTDSSNISEIINELRKDIKNNSFYLEHLVGIQNENEDGLTLNLDDLKFVDNIQKYSRSNILRMINRDYSKAVEGFRAIGQDIIDYDTYEQNWLKSHHMSELPPEEDIVVGEVASVVDVLDIVRMNETGTCVSDYFSHNQIYINSTREIPKDGCKVMELVNYLYESGVECVNNYGVPYKHVENPVDRVVIYNNHIYSKKFKFTGVCSRVEMKGEEEMKVELKENNENQICSNCKLYDGEYGKKIMSYYVRTINNGCYKVVNSINCKVNNIYCFTPLQVLNAIMSPWKNYTSPLYISQPATLYGETCANAYHYDMKKCYPTIFKKISRIPFISNIPENSNVIGTIPDRDIFICVNDDRFVYNRVNFEVYKLDMHMRGKKLDLGNATFYRVLSWKEFNGGAIEAEFKRICSENGWLEKAHPGSKYDLWEETLIYFLGMIQNTTINPGENRIHNFNRDPDIFKCIDSVERIEFYSDVKYHIGIWIQLQTILITEIIVKFGKAGIVAIKTDSVWCKKPVDEDDLWRYENDSWKYENETCTIPAKCGVINTVCEDKIEIICGLAGSGKSTYASKKYPDALVIVPQLRLREVECWRNRNVVSIAWIKNKHYLPRYNYYIIDEAFQVPRDTLEYIMCQISSTGGKCILVGDPHQFLPWKCDIPYDTVRMDVLMTNNYRNNIDWNKFIGKREELIKLFNRNTDKVRLIDSYEEDIIGYAYTTAGDNAGCKKKFEGTKYWKCIKNCCIDGIMFYNGIMYTKDEIRGGWSNFVNGNTHSVYCTQGISLDKMTLLSCDKKHYFKNARMLYVLLSRIRNLK